MAGLVVTDFANEIILLIELPYTAVAGFHARFANCGNSAPWIPPSAQRPQPYRLIFILLRETGMRVGEVLDLRWGDVILDSWREALRVREPKNGSERTVVLGPTATPRALRGLRAARRAIGRTPPAYELLFRSNRGTRVSYDAVRYQWAKLSETAGLLYGTGAPRYTPHQLRHTRGSDLIAHGSTRGDRPTCPGSPRHSLNARHMQGLRPHAS